MAKQEKTATIDPPQAQPLTVLELQTPAFRHVQRLLGSHVLHHAGCHADPCTCRLAGALEELHRLDILGRRYGDL